MPEPLRDRLLAAAVEAAESYLEGHEPAGVLLEHAQRLEPHGADMINALLLELARARRVLPTPTPIPVGSEVEIGGGAMLVQRYAIHAGMLGDPATPDVASNPIVLADLQGLDSNNDPASLRLVLPEALAVEVADAIAVSLAQLSALRAAGDQS